MADLKNIAEEFLKGEMEALGPLYMLENGTVTYDVIGHDVYAFYQEGMLGVVKCNMEGCQNVDGFYGPLSWSARMGYFCQSCCLNSIHYLSILFCFG